MKRPKLKPCPFCKSKNVFFYGKAMNYVKCEDCGEASVVKADKEQAAEAWNKRN